MKKLILTLAIVAFTVLAQAQIVNNEFKGRSISVLKKDRWHQTVENSVIDVIIDTLMSYKKRIQTLEKKLDSVNKPIFYTSGSSGIVFNSDCRDSIVVEWKKVTIFSLTNFDKNLYNWQTGWMKEEKIVRIGKCYGLSLNADRLTKTFYYRDKKRRFTNTIIDYRTLSK